MQISAVKIISALAGLFIKHIFVFCASLLVLLWCHTASRLIASPLNRDIRTRGYRCGSSRVSKVKLLCYLGSFDADALPQCDVIESEVNPWQDNEYFIKYSALPTIFWRNLHFAYKRCTCYVPSWQFYLSSYTWNAARKELTNVSKLLRDEAWRNFPPKSWAPSKAKMEMKRSKRRSRLFIEDIEPNRELTRSDMDRQYLVIINGFISMNNLIQMMTDDKWNSRLVLVHYSMQYVSLTSNESKSI